MWLVKYIEYTSGYGLEEFGVLPRHLNGLVGIITSPFIHGDLAHLGSNSIPMLLLGAGLVYFYKELAFKVFILIYFLSGFGLWLGGRELYHIGASGLIYGLAFFLFLSGVLRKDTRLMAISLLVVFLYGSMIWGVFPLWRGISWEAHLFGSLAGILTAFAFRHEGPQKPEFVWEEDQEEQDLEQPMIEQPDDENPIPQKQINIHYIYKEKNENGNESEKN